MVADIQKLEAAARIAMAHFETPGNSPVRRRSRSSSLGVLTLAILAIVATAVAMSGTF